MSFADDLPGDLPLFPLRGAILLPSEPLPLNVFEPRYLNMLDDVRRGAGHIGIIQPGEGGTAQRPDLLAVGCAGRLDAFEETEDGRYLIVLTGISRFRLVEEVTTPAPYRIGRADYDAYTGDVAPAEPLDGSPERLVDLTRRWFSMEGYATDYDAMANMPVSPLVDRLAMAAPFEPGERQRLLEADRGQPRRDVLEDLLLSRLAGTASGSAH